MPLPCYWFYSLFINFHLLFKKKKNNTFLWLMISLLQIVSHFSTFCFPSKLINSLWLDSTLDPHPNLPKSRCFTFVALTIILINPQRNKCPVVTSTCHSVMFSIVQSQIFIEHLLYTRPPLSHVSTHSWDQGGGVMMTVINVKAQGNYYQISIPLLWNLFPFVIGHPSHTIDKRVPSILYPSWYDLQAQWKKF